MEYQRSPFREKQRNYEMGISPKIPSFRKQQPSLNQKQNTHRSQFYLNKKTDSPFHNSNLEGTPKHITSQMINQFDHDYTEKQQRSYKRQNTYDAEIERNSTKFQENKKFNAKHFQIQSKLNKIQSYHHKIESLLDMVNRKPKTPSKLSDFSSPTTPNKTNTKHNSTTGSRSVSKISPLTTKYNKDFEGYKQTPPKQIRHHKYGEFTPTKYNRKNQQNLENGSNNLNTFDKNHPGKTQKFQELKSANRTERQFTRQNNYLGKNKGPSLRNQQEFKQSNRKKSKQYMKSIQGEVKDIQTTIELLNQKIKQVDNISFKKQIHFDNLSTSNPESVSDYHQKDPGQAAKSYTPYKTPNRFNKQALPHVFPTNNYTHQKDEDLSQHHTDIGYIKNGSFKKTNNGISAHSKYDIYPGTSPLNSNQRSSYKNQPVKMGNPYDADVEQSEQRNRFTLMQQIRRKRS